MVASGCGGLLPRPARLDFGVDPAALLKWNAVIDDKTQTLLCVKCFQPDIAPRWCRDRNRRDVLLWTCRHCRAVWLSHPASNLVTIP